MQTHVDDVFRGRVFSLYDVIFNVAFVAAAAVWRRAPARRQSNAVLVSDAAGWSAAPPGRDALGASRRWATRVPASRSAEVEGPEGPDLLDADATEHVGDLTVVDVALTSGPEEQTAR